MAPYSTSPWAGIGGCNPAHRAGGALADWGPTPETRAAIPRYTGHHHDHRAVSKPGDGGFRGIRMNEQAQTDTATHETLARIERSTGPVIISPDTLRENRIPPRQALTRKWPVLHAGNVPAY